MIKKQIASISVIGALSSLSLLSAQYVPADYQKADSLIQSYENKVWFKPVDCRSIKKTECFWYSVNSSTGKQYFIVDSKKPEKRPAFDYKKVIGMVADNAKESADKINLQGIEFTSQLDTLKFTCKGSNWYYLLKKNKLIKGEAIAERTDSKYWAESNEEQSKVPVISPDKKWKAYIKEYNLYIKDVEKNKEYQLSFNGSNGDYYSSNIIWSPNSKYIAVNQIRPNEKHLIYFIESSPKDQLQPKLQKREYLKPGDALPIKRTCLFHVEDKKQIPVNFGNYLNQFDIADASWRNDSHAFTIEYNERGHQKYQVIEINAQTGEDKVLINETSKTFFCYSSKKYRNDINDGKEIIWMSERDGWNHLYLYNADGSLKNQITKGEWVVRDVEKVDEQKREIIFCASGVDKKEDPYHKHYYKINFDGTGMVSLTPENANHTLTFSSDSIFMIDYYSRADMPGKTVLRKTMDGKVIMELENTDISALEKSNWKMPEVFTNKGRDGVTDIWGLIYRPTNFDPKKKYPVIEYIYAGPQDSYVPKSFTGYSRNFSGLAELGFIIVTIDGMGTSNRSKAFHDVCWKNLKDAGFPDRIKWIKAAAEKYSYMDTTRVGIFGGSAGGQNALSALLFYPEFYKAASSSCGCHDNRMDKIWWNEQWMGYPIGPQYEESSNVVNANRLKGDLLLIVGEVDDNVDPASTMQVVNALIKAGKEFELSVLPSTNHTLGGTYGERKRRDFFVKHLLNAESPKWNCKAK